MSSGLRVFGFVSALLLVFSAEDARATDPPPVPAALQMQLVAKVASYDRNLAERAKGTVKIALYYAPNDPVSEHTANQARAALADIKTIGGMPHSETEMRFEGAQALRDACKAQGLSIVYLAPGLSQHTAHIRAALDGVDVLSATATPSDVGSGIVLGVDSVSGRSQLFFNLPQAKAQHVELGADVLRIMTVYR